MFIFNCFLYDFNWKKGVKEKTIILSENAKLRKKKKKKIEIFLSKIRNIPILPNKFIPSKIKYPIKFESFFGEDLS